MPQNVSARKWLIQNDYADIAALIDIVMDGWKTKETKTRRNWWDVLAGGENGKPRTIEGVTFPVLKAAQIRKGVPITDNTICRNEAEEVPKVYVTGRWVNHYGEKKMKYDFDVTLSFAGEDRVYVDAVAMHLRSLDINVFYDKLEEISLWGKNLYLYLDEIYQRRAEFCVVFASQNYVQKAWAKHELQSAYSRALNSKTEYILPARFDETELPGLILATSYVELQGKEPHEFAQMIARKIGKNLDFENTLSYLRSELPDFRIEYNSTSFIFENETESYYAEFPIRILIDMYKLGVIDPMFIMSGILVI